jgi:hypothetical protein
LFAAEGAQTSFNGSFALVGGKSTVVERKLPTTGTWDFVRINGSDSLDTAITRYNNNDPQGDISSAAPSRRSLSVTPMTPTLAHMAPVRAHSLAILRALATTTLAALAGSP